MNPPPTDSASLSRREVLAGAVSSLLAVTAIPSTAKSGAGRPIRAVNIMNFMRAEEPRVIVDLMEPVRRQMEIVKSLGLPATWLLQYDALVGGPFVEFLKRQMPPDHEVGVWFEMNRRICEDAGLEWRGNPKWGWDWAVPVAYSIGYRPEERRRLADTAAATFQRVFGRPLRSVACWNLDAVTVAHFADRHGIDAFGNCRDQIATDGYTIWGAPIAGYYPNRANAWSPAGEAKNQINSPIFRLLGQDPVYYYDNTFPAPDTMEPGWASGRSEVFVQRFLDMISRSPTGSLAYAQLGQENSFGWPAMTEAYPMQMRAVARLREEGALTVETMGETGRRFKRAFKMTPPQAQVMLQDPFDKGESPERTIWYQSKYYRANIHFRGDRFYLRDLHVYSDQFAQPFLTDPVREHGIEQRLLAVLDGYHWSGADVREHRPGRRAKGGFVLVAADGRASEVSMTGEPVVSESGSTLRTALPLAGGGTLHCVFRERFAEFSVTGAPKGSRVGLEFEWAPTLSALKHVSRRRIDYRFQDFDYSVGIVHGEAVPTDAGVSVRATSSAPLRLDLAQPAEPGPVTPREDYSVAQPYNRQRRIG